MSISDYFQVEADEKMPDLSLKQIDRVSRIANFNGPEESQFNRVGVSRRREEDKVNIDQYQLNPSVKFTFNNHTEFLREITTVINCEEDLKLYKYRFSHSTAYMSVVGIEILREDLQQVYGGFTYLLRAYVGGVKFFELPLMRVPRFVNIYNTVICYMFDNPKQIYAIDIGGVYNTADLGKRVIGREKEDAKKTPMKKVSVLKHDFEFEVNELMGFRVSHFNLGAGQDAAKLVFYTNTRIFILPFNLDKSQITNESSKFYEKNAKEITLEDIECKGDPAMPYVDESIEGDEYENEEEKVKFETLVSKNSQLPIDAPIEDPDDVRIKRIFGIGLAKDYRPEYSFSLDDKSELLLFEDYQNQLQICIGKIYGTSFERIGLIPFKSKYAKGKKQSYEIMDAKLISVFKVLVILKITHIKASSEKLNPLASSLPLPATILEKNEYQVQIFEIGSEIKKTVVFNIYNDFSDEYLTTWRKLYVEDYNNNLFFFPEMSKKRDTANPEMSTYYNMIGIDNQESGLLDTLNINNQIICDIVGSNVEWTTDGKHNSAKQGLLYQDFIVVENQLFIAHGKFITIVNTDDPIKIASRHLSLNQQYEESINCFDFSDNVSAVFFADVESKNVYLRWKVLALFNNGVLKMVHESDKYKGIRTQKHQREGNPLLKGNPYDTKYLIPEVKYYELHALKNSNIRRKDNKVEDVVIQGKILKTWRNSNSKTTPVYFLVQKKDQVVILALNFYDQQVEEYQIKDLKADSTIVVLNQDKDIDAQPFLIVNQKEKQMKQYAPLKSMASEKLLENQIQSNETDLYEQEKVKVKLLINQYNQQGNIIIEETDLPKDMQLVSKAQSIFVSDKYAYFIYDRGIDQLDLEKNESLSAKSFQSISDFQVFDDSYFYWRQTETSQVYFPLRSSVYLEKLPTIGHFTSKCQDENLTLFTGLYPHHKKIHLDRQSETLSAFTDFNTIKIWPLLHTSKIKLKNAGFSKQDALILGSQLYGHKLYTIHSDNTMKEYNIMTSKLIAVKRIYGFDGYQFQQQINSKQILLRSTEFLDEQKEEEGNANGRKSRFSQSAVLKKDPKKLDIQKDFGISSLNSSTVRIAKYKVIEFTSTEPTVQKKFMLSEKVAKGVIITNLFANDSTIDYVQLNDVCSFDGPCLDQKSNFGLYVSEDLNMYVFYFRDLQRNLLIFYYKSVKIGEGTHLKLQKLCDAEGIRLSLHSPSLTRYISIKKNTNQFSMENYNKNHIEQIAEEIKKLEEEELMDQSDKIQELIQMQTQAQNDFLRNSEIYQQIQSIYNASPGTFPNYISESEILFMNSDRIIMAYDIEQRKEAYNFTQCLFPSSTGEINLGSMIQSNDMLIGENCMIYERIKDLKGPNKDYERVFPNNFNYFLKEQAHQLNDSDMDEMRYLQHNYKNKIEIMSQSYFGYILQSKNFTKEYETVINIVNTFSFYQWRTLDLLEYSNKLSLDSIPQQTIQELCYCQMANGHTILHKIFRNIKTVQQLYSLVQDDDPTTEQFYIPIFSHVQQDSKNRSEISVLDILLRSQEAQEIKHFTSQIMQKYRHIQKDADLTKSAKTLVEEQKINKLKNYNKKQYIEHKRKSKINVAFFILQQIGTYPFDLFKVDIERLIKPIISADIEMFCKFIDMRSKQPDFLQNISEGNIITNKTVIFTKHDLFQVNEDQLSEWVREDDKFLAGTLGLRTLGAIQMKVIDIPYIHTAEIGDHNDNVNFIFDALYEMDSLEPYGYGAVRALIEVRWQYVFYRILYLLMLPYACLMAVFTLYTIKDWQSYIATEQAGERDQALICRIVLMTLIGYFVFVNLMLLIGSSAKKHLKNYWNIIEIFSYAMILGAEWLAFTSRRRGLLDNGASIDDLTNEQIIEMTLIDYRVRLLYSLAALGIWFKSLYFFRIIRKTGYFIRMMIEVVIDLGSFIFIFAIIIIAFALAFILIERDNTSGPVITTFFIALQQSYQIPMGNYFTGYQNFQTWASWIYFMWATLIVNIMLLNLLISVISDTYARIKDDYKMIMYKDLLNVINENKLLYKGRKTQELTQKYLFFTIPAEKDDPTQPILDKIDIISSQLRQLINIYKKKEEKQQLLGKIDQKEKLIIEKLDALKEQLEKKGK